MATATDPQAEWLEADGLGGFASGTVSGVRSRRYHALLLAATTPPTGRMVLVNGFDAFVETTAGLVALSSQHYAPDVIHPDGARRVQTFAPRPWPTWTYELGDGTRVRHETTVLHERALVVLSWRRIAGSGPALLSVRPFFSGRDYHALQHENPAFRFAPAPVAGRLVWRPYDGVPAVAVAATGRFEADPQWYRSFLYREEAARGLDSTEDLAAPGVWRFDLAAGDAVLVLAAEGHEAGLAPAEAELRAWAVAARRAEATRREALGDALQQSADAYVVRRAGGRTVVAGYPWFTDWGRDTFIALRGLCLAIGRLDAAREILLEWSGHVSEGMLPNRFPDAGAAPEYNAVDASLWYVVAVHEFLAAARADASVLRNGDVRALEAAVAAILGGYARGTRHGIRMDADCLLAAGEPGAQLTWMDARVGDRVVTPRIGKPVEVQALWLNALALAAARTPRFRDWFGRGAAAFAERFWNEAAGCLYDVVDVDHQPGAVDPSMRPNQIFAVGGLPEALLAGERARRVVDAVEARLLTPLGLRSLAPGEPGYAPRYAGGPHERDAAYHQGTAWPWLLGPFAEAWVRVRAGRPAARREARRRFLEPLRAHTGEAGLEHVSEIADAEPPQTPRGCPFQAWSLGELLRLDRVVLAERASGRRPHALVR